MVAVALFIHFRLHTRSHCEEIIKHISVKKKRSQTEKWLILMILRIWNYATLKDGLDHTQDQFMVLMFLK